MKIKTASYRLRRATEAGLDREPAFRHPAVEKYLAGGVVA